MGFWAKQQVPDRRLRGRLCEPREPVGGVVVAVRTEVSAGQAWTQDSNLKTSAYRVHVGRTGCLVLQGFRVLL